MTEPQPRPPKKTELLEVRLTPESKRTFLEACRTAGRTASDVVREAVEAFVARERERLDANPEQRTLITMIPKPVRKKRYLAAAVCGMAGLAGLLALPSAATPNLRAKFDQADKNHDGVVTPQEFFGADFDIETVRETRRSQQVDAVLEEPRVGEHSFAVLVPPEDAAAGEWMIEMQLGVLVRARTDHPDDRPPAPPRDDPRAYAFAGMDANRDEAVSYDEYQVRGRALLARGFDLLDRDQDARLTAEEFGRAAHPEQLLQPAGNVPDYPDGKPRDGAPAATPGAFKAGFTELDANRDGSVTLQEYLPSV